MAKEDPTKITFDFDREINREDTDAEKYDARLALFGKADVIPMWVADMDLPTPSFILDALKTRLEHPILGYTLMSDNLYRAVIDWQAHNQYHVQQDDICWTHNVANGFHLAVQAFTNPGDTILVQPPVYPPFLKAPALNDRNCIQAPLSLINGRYEIDFETFERTLIQHNIKLFLFCNPQNPSGRVWLKHELLQLGELCIKHQVIMVSDEIHSDLIYAGHSHIPIASLSESFAQNTVTLSSPGKTFNLGGLQIGYAIIANRQLRADFQRASQRLKIQDLNLFGAIALQAAYSPLGMDYKKQLVNYLQNNINDVETFIRTQTPNIKMMRPEASYLIWLDFSELFSDQAQLKNWLIFEAQLGLVDGTHFGSIGHGFMRMNIALPKSKLAIALKNLKNAVLGLHR